MAIDKRGRKLPKGIQQRYDKFEGRFQYQGKRYLVHGDTVTETQKAMNELRYKLEHGAFVEKKKVVLSEWFTTWMEQYKKNTLNSIRYFARIYQAPEIREMTTALIQLSKASLSSEKFITIKQELELTRQYLAIQKMRYGDILQFSCTAEEDLTDCMVPRFCIQPVVENALFHGILPKGAGKAVVEISSRESGLLIKISDDGIGMSEEEIFAANQRLRGGIFGKRGKEDISGLKNIGLENINYRIRINYKGRGAGVYLRGKREGLLVILWIPQRIRETGQDG